MRRNQIILGILAATVLSASLTGCGVDEGTQAVEERVMGGKQAESAVDKAKEVDQRQSDQIDGYLGESSPTG